MNQKLVIVINGKGGVGKDTLCEAAAEHFTVRNISAITPIKEIAAGFGWQGEKDAKSRRFLAMLKEAFAEYNDLPTRYLLDQYRQFIQSDAQILFVHIREQDQIRHFVESVPTKCVTLLIQGRMQDVHYGNTADDEVESFAYDYYFKNDQPKEISCENFVRFLEDVLNS